MIVLVLFAEDRGHQQAVQRLTDRMLCEPAARGPANWITKDHLEGIRRWRGVEDGHPFTRLKVVHEIADRNRVPRLHGKFDGAAGAADATLCRKALRTAQTMCKRGVLECDAVIIARDLDRARTRRGFDQARAEDSWPFKVVLASADPEVEAWLLAGFVPHDETEQALLADVRREIGFDPTREPHRLRSTASSPKDAKKRFEQLTRNLRARQGACLEASLDMLRTNGAECSLADFLDDVEREIVPLFRGWTPA